MKKSIFIFKKEREIKELKKIKFRYNKKKLKKISNKKGKKLNKLIFKLLLIIFLSFSIYYQIFFIIK